MIKNLDYYSLDTTQKNKKIGRQIPSQVVRKDSYDSESYSDIELKKYPLYNEKLKPFVKKFNIKPFPWQEYILNDIFATETKENKTKAYSNIFFCVPRQNGKSEIMIIVILLKLIAFQQSVLYTSYDAKSSTAIFNRLTGLIEKNSFLSRYFPQHLRSTEKAKTLYIKAINPITGKEIGSCYFATRKGGVGRGNSYHTVIFDEAQHLKQSEVDAIAPTTTTFEGQMIFLGTPSTESSATIGRNSGIRDSYFEKEREKCLTGKGAYTSYMEWGITDSTIDRYDKKYWYYSNPSLGLPIPGRTGLTERTLEAKSSMNDESFKIEHLGFWYTRIKNRYINPDDYSKIELIKEDFKGRVPGGSPLTIGIKVDDLSTEVSLCYIVKDKRYIQHIISENNISGNYENNVFGVIESYLRDTRRTKSVIIDGNNRQLFINLLIKKGLWNNIKNKSIYAPILQYSPRDIATSCFTLTTRIKQGTIFIQESDRIKTAIEDNGKRKIGSYGYGFESLSGQVQVSILESIAIALESSYRLEKSQTLTDNEIDNNLKDFRII